MDNTRILKDIPWKITIFNGKSHHFYGHVKLDAQFSAVKNRHKSRPKTDMPGICQPLKFNILRITPWQSDTNGKPHQVEMIFLKQPCIFRMLFFFFDPKIPVNGRRNRSVILFAKQCFFAMLSRKRPFHQP